MRYGTDLERWCETYCKSLPFPRKTFASAISLKTHVQSSPDCGVRMCQVPHDRL